MNPARAGRRSGMVLMELVVAMGVISLVSILGLRAIQVGLEGLAREAAYQEEAVAIALLREAVCRAWDSRLAHAMGSGPWLVLEGTKRGDDDVLERLWLKTVNEAGEAEEWKLERVEPGWQMNGHQIPFDGEIMIQPGALTCLPGERPPILHVRFPGARRSDLRQGFAIVALW